MKRECERTRNGRNQNSGKIANLSEMNLTKIQKQTNKLHSRHKKQYYNICKDTEDGTDTEK